MSIAATPTAIGFTPGVDTAGMHILLVDEEAVVVTPSFFDAYRTFHALGREHFASHVLWMKDDAVSGLVEQASRPAYDNACCGSDF